MSRNVSGTAGFEESKGKCTDYPQRGSANNFANACIRTGGPNDDKAMQRQKPSKRERQQDEEIEEQAAASEQVLDVVAE